MITETPTTIEVCTCCVLALANGDDCTCAEGDHPVPEGVFDSVSLGAIGCEWCADDQNACESWFSRRPCDLCQSPLGGDRHHATAWTN